MRPAYLKIKLFFCAVVSVSFFAFPIAPEAVELGDPVLGGEVYYIFSANVDEEKPESEVAFIVTELGFSLPFHLTDTNKLDFSFAGGRVFSDLAQL